MTEKVSRFLPYGRQDIDEADVAAVVGALKGDWLTGGPAPDAFEGALADTFHASHAVVCANGTAALHLAAMALDLGPNDIVVVPAMTFAATANAVRFVGAEVLFCDVDATTGLATPDTVAAALDEAGTAAKAVIVVHLNGQSADMVGIGRIARSRGVTLVEDACHAIGATSITASGAESPIGSCVESSMAVFSFHPVKTITAGEGGAVSCREPGLAKRLRRLRNHGITRDPADFRISTDVDADPWHYEMMELGYNYRITDIQCALGMSQLRRLPEFVSRRAALASTYDRLLARLAPIVQPIRRAEHGMPAWHLYAVLIDFEAGGRSRSKIMNGLRGRGIGTQVHYLPVNRHPYYVNRYGTAPLRGADAYYARCLSLPLFPAMTEQDVHEVVNALVGVLR
jgi:UDP-4-amino-4,6-dideoxy-N-acetyl-beta-L-altrosamine transaminase